MSQGAEIWSGRELADVIEEEVRAEVTRLTAREAPPRLVVLLVGEDPASHVYVGQKSKAAARVGINAETRTFPADLPEEALRREIHELNQEPSVDGILVQLPLPLHLDPDTMLSLLDPSKDVDGFHPVNIGRLAAGGQTFVPCTPLGVGELLRRRAPWGPSLTGRDIVVVGRGRTVGLPLSLLLGRREDGWDATVTVCHTFTHNLAGHTRRAEVLVVAAGEPHLIKADMVRPGAIVIDVGITRVPDPSQPRGYRLVGDVDFEAVRHVARAITPVPGGVGPLTVAMLLKNTLDAALRRSKAGTREVRATGATAGSRSP